MLNKFSSIFICVSIAFGASSGCRVEQESCVGCHTDKTKLKEVADPIEDVEAESDG